MSDNCSKAVHAVELAITSVKSLDELGHGLVDALSGFISMDRFNIGLIDQRQYLFCDEFAYGHNVAGRKPGHRRTLDGSVVEAAIKAGDGFYFGNENLQQWLEHFPRFEPVFNSGIRAMLSVPLTYNQQVSAALVFASRDANAYEPESLAIAIAVGEVVAAKLESLEVQPGPAQY